MVVEVDATSCKVMTILHPSFNAAGVISRTRENGIITGSADYAADGQCVLTNLDRATEARKGDQVITTGLGGVFPWALCRKWCRSRAASPPVRSSCRVPTRARSSMCSSLPNIKEADVWNLAASAAAARS